jgi:hypothetical protein
VVLSRTRGKADGHLRITGRDVDEAEHALTFDPLLGSWTLLEGPALDHLVGDTRAAILGYLRQQVTSRPKQVADSLELDHELVKKTLQRMADDGQVDTDGTGSTSSPPSPLSLVSPLSPRWIDARTTPPELPHRLGDVVVGRLGEQRPRGQLGGDGDGHYFLPVTAVTADTTVTGVTGEEATA